MNKSLELTGAALAGAVLIGTIGLVTNDDIQYAESVKYHMVNDKRIAAHREPVYADSTVDDSTTVRVVVDSVDVPEQVKRERALYRTPDDSTYSVGDTVRMAIMVKRGGGKWVVQGYSDKPITEPASDGKKLAAYGRLVIWERSAEVVDNEIQ